MSCRELNDDSPMPFGTYKGIRMSMVPASYLDWLIGQKWIKDLPAVERYILENKRAIEEELEDRDL